MEDKLTIDQIKDLELEQLKDVSEDNLNVKLDELDDLGTDVKAIMTEKLYKKLQKDTDRGIQKISEENKVLADHSYLIKLFDEKPELANEIAKKHFEGITREEAIEKLNSDPDKKNDEDKPLTKKEWEALEQQKKQNQLIEGFRKDMELKGDELAKFNQEFDDLSGGRKLDEEKTLKLLKIAYSQVFPVDNRGERMARDMAIGTGTSKGEPKSSGGLSKSQKDAAAQIAKQYGV